MLVAVRQQGSRPLSKLTCLTVCVCLARVMALNNSVDGYLEQPGQSPSRQAWVEDKALELALWRNGRCWACSDERHDDLFQRSVEFSWRRSRRHNVYLFVLPLLDVVLNKKSA